LYLTYDEDILKKVARKIVWNLKIFQTIWIIVPALQCVTESQRNVEKLCVAGRECS